MKERIVSVDIFRGLTVMLMTVVNNPGSWNSIYPPLEHAEWHGCTPTDLVFPSFLFIVGMSTVFARKSDITSIAIRGLRIFNLGIFLNFFSKIHVFGLEGTPLLIVRLLITALAFYLFLTEYNKKWQFIVALGSFVLFFVLAFSTEMFSQVRIPGVLQRIALVYFIVALLYQSFSNKGLIIIGLGILLGYWAIMALIPIDGVTGNFEPDVNVAANFDRIFLSGHMWASSKTWDPEGLLSTLPAIGTALLGIFMGQLLLKSREESEKLNQMIYFGLGFVIVGYLWNYLFPINKALWTSSYVLYAGGLATLSVALIQLAVEQFGKGAWTKPFIIFGVNPMFVFFLSGILPRVWGNFHIGEKSFQPYIVDELLNPLFSDPKMASLSWALLYLLFWFIILTILHRKRIIIKV
ncbi:DUF5009 domain-containing protein [Marinilongibacter aquaticus]|uniref:acyltransferase family protein n=1 Tax=Marinilongibacter aquaticus TaxID=2975157 RepID=UPI0021BD910A|nr:DUF5009 domain-containing protein [Marinilongibacter aquaticus]UBM57343.1 DUF5009 domain-containing protein [Marinilongibacter aquaticus]